MNVSMLFCCILPTLTIAEYAMYSARPSVIHPGSGREFLGRPPSDQAQTCVYSCAAVFSWSDVSGHGYDPSTKCQSIFFTSKNGRPFPLVSRAVQQAPAPPGSVFPRPVATTFTVTPS